MPRSRTLEGRGFASPTLLALLLLTSAACRTPIKTVDTGCQPLEEIPYDGVDQDCDGQDLTDVDGDGFDAPEAGGQDCDDSDATVYPGATEEWYDGVDQDCDGASDFDQDQDGFDSDGHDGADCDDADASVNPNADEVWYDGVDQDCDGASDFDQDQDGHDSSEYGGLDCDDMQASINPEVPEQPYDGIDQDCDGADLTDVDGDTYDATEVGGDDCDDQDASVFPGASEVLGDGTDQDCDGLVDEHLVCADGSGDYTLIQDAIDDVADGSVIEICPGTYSERLILSSRTLEITGGGELPEDVLLTPPTGAAGIQVSGGELAISNLTLEAAAGQKAIRMTDGASLDTDLIDLCGSGYLGHDYAIEVITGEDALASGSSTTLYRSKFCDCTAIAGSYGFGDVTVTGCVFDSAGLRSGQYSSATIQNNIFYGDAVHIRISQNSDYHIRNNVFASISDFYFYALINYHVDTQWPEVEVYSNIFQNIVTTPPDATSEVSALWAVYLGDDSIDDDGAPELWSNNIVWDTTGDYAEVCVWSDAVWNPVCDGADASAVMAAGSLTLDPLFATDEEKGTYALDPSSPAIDRGLGGSDIDGTRNDIGAFGGPEGDWYLEVPWLP